VIVHIGVGFFVVILFAVRPHQEKYTHTIFSGFFVIFVAMLPPACAHRVWCAAEQGTHRYAE
jgi:hypothetical protein